MLSKSSFFGKNLLTYSLSYLSGETCFQIRLLPALLQARHSVGNYTDSLGSPSKFTERIFSTFFFYIFSTAYLANLCKPPDSSMISPQLILIMSWPVAGEYHALHPPPFSFIDFLQGFDTAQ